MAGLQSLARALDSKQARTSFGKLPLSIEKSQPSFGFSQARRDQDKQFLGADLTKQSNTGKLSPGPVYQYDDNIKYQKNPGWGFGSSDKMSVIKPKYDFYENAAFLDDPHNADLSRKPKAVAHKIGTEPRMQLNNLESSPGPQYYPKDRPEVQQLPKYTFGFRRGNALKNASSSPNSVGPGRYVPEASANPSTQLNQPKWTLPKAGRTHGELKSLTKNQTYDTRSSIGAQPTSNMKTSPKATFGSSGRDQTSKTGHFKDLMQGQANVKLYHPNW
eukprot:403368860